MQKKNIIGLKKLKIKIIKKEKREFKNRRKKKGGKGEHPTELQKTNVEPDIYNNNRKCD